MRSVLNHYFMSFRCWSGCQTVWNGLNHADGGTEQVCTYFYYNVSLFESAFCHSLSSRYKPASCYFPVHLNAKWMLKNVYPALCISCSCTLKSECVCSSSGEEEGSREKGLLYRWQGYFCRVTPERLLLSRPVLHAALGTLHGLLLTEGQKQAVNEDEMTS